MLYKYKKQTLRDYIHRKEELRLIHPSALLRQSVSLLYGQDLFQQSYIGRPITAIPAASENSIKLANIDKSSFLLYY